MTKIAVGNLLPNPFRHLERYPIDKEKVATLVASINSTDFWDNLLVRESPDKRGKFEIAYGHHRLKALQSDKLQAKLRFIDVPVRDLSDEDMLKIMANENMTEWSHNAAIEQETVHAVIEAFATGTIKLAKAIVSKSEQVRIAPSCIPIRDGTKIGDLTQEAQAAAYTSTTIAKFLGWNIVKVKGALAGLSAIEEGRMEQEDFTGLSTSQARAVADSTIYAAKALANEPDRERKVRNIGKQLAIGMRQSVQGHDRFGRARQVQDVTIHTARARTDEMIRHHAPNRKVKELPNAKKFIEEFLRTHVHDYPSPVMIKKLETVVAARDGIDKQYIDLLVGGLRGAAKRLDEWADKLRGRV